MVWMIAAIASSSEIQGHCWVPEPRGPEMPNAVSVSSGLSTPSRWITGAIRRFVTTAGGEARRAADSMSPQMSAKNPVPPAEPETKPEEKTAADAFAHLLHAFINN